MKSEIFAILSFIARKINRTPLGRMAWLYHAYAGASLWLHGSNNAKVGPFTVQFDPSDRYIAKNLVVHGGYEKNEIDLLCSFVKPGDCVLDIGANIGLYSLFLSQKVGAGGRVIAVEPDPENLLILRANLEKNGCNNVVVLPCALGTESKVTELFQASPNNRGNLSMVDFADTGHPIKVPLRRGEEVLEELGVRPDIVKMDIEGAEPLAFEGLGYKPSTLLFEYSPSLLRGFGYDPEMFLESLIEGGYSLEFIDWDNGKRVRGTPSEITTILEQDHRYHHCNILARL